MGQIVELQEDIGLSTGRLDSDMRTSLDCSLFVSIAYLISILSTVALITALLLSSSLRSVLFCLLNANPSFFMYAL